MEEYKKKGLKMFLVGVLWSFVVYLNTVFWWFDVSRPTPKELSIALLVVLGECIFGLLTLFFAFVMVIGFCIVLFGEMDGGKCANCKV